MKKALIISTLVLSLLLISIPFIRANVLREQPTEVFYSVSVILDAGHGGKDGGASSRDGLIERELVFNITKFVEENLRLQGFNVILTRFDEHDLASDYATNRKREDLNRRAKIMNSCENAIAVSIHANSINNTRWRGAQTFYDPRSLENKELATHIMEAMRANISEVTREQRPISNIYILRNSEIPTALVEVGFLSNPDEARLLACEDYQRLLAYAIFEGILSYIEVMGLNEPAPLAACDD